MEAISLIAMKVLTTTLSTLILSSLLKNKNVDRKILDELIRGMRELKIEMSALKKDTRLGTSQSTERLKGFLVRYIWCNDLNHKYSDYGLYTNTIKNNIITFKEDKIRDVATDELLKTNFER